MAKPFYELRERLLRAGVAPRHVRRYLTELTDHLADLRAEEKHAGRSRADAEAAALARLGNMEDLARAMLEKRQLQSWSSRAPWAIFGIAPVSMLAGAWFVALFILWSGWQIFMPGAETPFGTRLAGPVYGFENVYFQVGRMIYFGAPFVIGWGFCAIAARQRLQAVWPVLGLIVLACIAGTAQVQASRPAGPGGTPHVGVGFAIWPSHQGLSDSLVHVLVILSITLLPYLVWRIQRARSLSA
jgi:hypothetical protein